MSDKTNAHPHIIHWNDTKTRLLEFGEMKGEWSDLGRAAGTQSVGVRRVKIAPAHRSTPLHVHGAEEEIFYILSGDGVLLEGDHAFAVRAGDCIVELPNKKAHTFKAGESGMELLAYGERVPLSVGYLPRQQQAWAGPTVLAGPGRKNLFEDEVELGPIPVPELSERAANIVHRSDVPSRAFQQGKRGIESWDLARPAGSKTTGLRVIKLQPDHWGPPLHCHSAEEEIFVVLSGTGVCQLGEDSFDVEAGSVIARPPGTGVAHAFRANEAPLEFLAYGTREPNDICYYPDSNKIFWRGVGVIGRIEKLEYWDGEL